MPYLLVYLHQKQSSKIGLETRPKIKLSGPGLTTLLIILIVHSNRKIMCSRKPLSGRMMSRQVVMITWEVPNLHKLPSYKSKPILTDV